MFTLDDILSASTSPRIISEEHDTSKIDWRAAMMGFELKRSPETNAAVLKRLLPD